MKSVGEISVIVGRVAEVFVGISAMVGWVPRFLETMETVVW